MAGQAEMLVRAEDRNIWCRLDLVDTLQFALSALDRGDTEHARELVQEMDDLFRAWTDGTHMRPGTTGTPMAEVYFPEQGEYTEHSQLG